MLTELAAPGDLGRVPSERSAMAAAPKLRLAVRRSLSAAALTAATLAGAAPAEPPAPTSGRRLALLIGVNEYDAVPDLRGAVNDVELLRSVLSSKAGFAERDIELLLDRAATRRGIFEAIDRLAARAKPSDVVYVHYSGHGSQVKDLNGDEADGLDETLVPTNGRTKNVADITDDELAERLARVRAESVAIVLDACHSGTGTRRVLQRRSVPRDERSELYAQNATRAVVPIAGKRHVLMSGAASDEEALDGPVDGRPHGLFSYALARSLGRLGPEASPRDLFAGAGSELERIKAQLGLHRLPEPQLEGDERRLASPLFATRAEAPAPARLPWVPALRRGPGHALLRGAVALGAAPGSLWAVYGPDEREFAPGVALAEAEVVEHAGADAIARFTPAEAAFAPGARAVLIAPPLPDEAIPVRVAAPDPARAARLQNALRAKLPTLRFTAPGEFARFHLELAGERWQLLGADGRSEVVPLANEDEGSVVAAIAAQLERSLSAAELLALDNPASGFAITLGLVAPEGTSFRVRMPGEPRLPENSLQLRVSTPRACSLTLVDVDSAGLVQVIFPNPISEQHGYAPGGRLEAGATLDIPDSLASPNRAGFFVDYAPPTGIDTVRAFCATDPRAATALRRAIAQIPAERSATSRAAVRSALLAARGALTRGVRIVADGAAEEMPPDEALPASSDWAASSLTVRVAQ
jgi:hypothetical protein